MDVRFKREFVVAKALLLWSAALSPGAGAYTGGPVRAQIHGYEPDEGRIYFRLQAFDETGSPPEIYYLDLGTPSPSAIRLPALEDRETNYGKRVPSADWWKIVDRLLPLEVASDFELLLSVTSDSLNVDTDWNVRRFDLRAAFRAGDLSAEARWEAVCQPLVRVRALYEVPGRTERLALVSYIGRAYGCEEVDVPVVLRRGTD